MLYKEINSMKIRTIVIFLFMLAMLILVVSLKDYVNSMSTSMEAMQNSQGAKWAEKFTGQSLTELFKRMQSNDFYIWSQWYAKNFGQFLPLIALIIAFPIFARETEKKTIYFLLSRKRRRDVFKVKSLTGLFATIIVIFLLSILAPITMDIFGKHVNFGPVWKYTLQSVVSGVFFYNVYMLFSIFFNDTVKVIITGIIFFIGDFMLGLIQQLSFLNLFGYISSVHVFKTGNVDWVYTIWLLIISELIYQISLQYFYKKDF
jgi:ABC-2 type transport system permease protein